MISTSLKKFTELESASGILLVISAALALICANVSILDELYQALLVIPVHIKIGNLELKKNLLLLINDGLMAIFFLLVALEIKREILEGELSSLPQLALPSIGALGGVLAPACIYTILNHSDSFAMRGWATPTATDIAFSLGVLSLLGSRIPIGLKVFLTTLAVLDDLGAIIIIAFFYAKHLSGLALCLASFGFIVLILFNRAGITRLTPYFLIGICMWLCVLKSGVHATLAGVLLGFTIPHKNLNNKHSPLKQLEHMLHPWVAFMILPMFAFANSGLSFKGLNLNAFTHPVTLGIGLGLLLGKPLGIFIFSYGAVKLKIAALPQNTSWISLIGIGILGGIGFTMSLFIGSLAFADLSQEILNFTKLGVFGGSLLSGILGYLFLAWAYKKT